MKSQIEVGGACGKNERGQSTSDGNMSTKRESRGRSHWRWRYCIEGDINRAEMEDEDWRTVVKDREQ